MRANSINQSFNHGSTRQQSFGKMGPELAKVFRRSFSVLPDPRHSELRELAKDIGRHDLEIELLRESMFDGTFSIGRAGKEPKRTLTIFSSKDPIFDIFRTLRDDLSRSSEPGYLGKELRIDVPA